MPNSINLFKECLEHKEPLLDKFYCRDNLIISPSHEETTDVMRSNQSLIERITAAKVSLDDGNNRSYSDHIKKISEILQNKNMNFVEFTSFFPCLDISFSAYKKLTQANQHEFLHKAVNKYIKKRHHIYMSHGYTATSIQVRKDFEKHKTEGKSGDKKVLNIFKKHRKFSEFKNGNFSESRNSYCSVETSVGKKALADIRKNKKMNLRFLWASKHENKKPDILFSNSRGHIFICEMKHMKESGGGQDKQMNELIDFINYKERSNNVHYVSFLDGTYFNKLKEPPRGKILNQKNKILRCLKKNPGYYFINTFGLKTLIKNIG